MSVHTAVVRLLRLLLITLLYLEVAAAVPYSRHFRRNATLSSYDFIIVGGGTAGLTLAARLTESGDQSVLVLEAGYEPETVQQYKSPGADMAVLGSPLDWGFVTEPEETLLNRTITYNRGRGLGGSSLISGLAYTRGSKSIYDLWQSLGNSGWSWDDVFPLFKKSTHFNPSKLNSSYMEFDPEAYGDGPLQVGYPGYVSPASVAFVESLSAINVTPVADLNSGDGVGTKQETLTLDDSYQRSSSYDSFYAQARGRPNLTVKKGALVTQILLEQGTAGLTATGVVFTDYLGGATVNATASKEVIMAAGTFQTPQLLMLSGIGPKDVMESVGVSMIYLDNPNIGQHMEDHSYFSIYVQSTTAASESALYENIYNLQQAEAQYAASKTGMLTAPVGPAFGFEQISPAELAAAGATDLLANRSDQAHSEYLIETIYFPNIPVAGYHPITGVSYLSVTAAVVAPSSRGSVTLRSNSGEDAPVIDVNYLKTTADQNLAIRNFRNLRKILAAPEMQKWTIGPNNGEVAPGPSVESDADILNYIRSNSWPVWHACGTCRMLPEDQGGVVDERLRVYGVTGLRIVDASIIPVIPDAHTQAVVYMIAEKAAVMIKEDWGF